MNFKLKTFKPLSKKLLVLLVILVGVVTVTLIVRISFSGRTAQVKVPETSLVEQTVQPDEDAFKKLSLPEPGIPKHINIKNGLVSADIIMVGKDNQGFMETPKNWQLAGWYNLSSKTAQNGHIIINGHYDDNFGRPAAFWQLKNVVLGDSISLVDEFNRPFDYTVTEVYYLAIDDPDRFKLFNYEKGSQTLTVITCGGVWLSGEKTYNKRLVVRASRVE